MKPGSGKSDDWDALWFEYRRNRRNDIIKIVIVLVLVFGVVIGRELVLMR